MAWEQLLEIIEVNRQYLEDERAEKANPTQCPVCTGELVEGPTGGLHCRFDGWDQYGRNRG